MQSQYQTPVTERLNPVQTRQNLTPRFGFLVVLIVGALIYHQLGGISLDTTVSIVIKVPAWIMFVGGAGLFIAAVFFVRYNFEYLFGDCMDVLGNWIHGD